MTSLRGFLAACLILLSGPAYGTELQGRVVGLADGDTLTLLTTDRQQVKVRLADIDAPERGQPYGDRARQELASLVFSQEISGWEKSISTPFRCAHGKWTNIVAISN